MLSSTVAPAAMAQPVYRIDEGPMDLVSRHRAPPPSDHEHGNWLAPKPTQIHQVPSYYHYGYYPLVERLPHPVANIPYAQGYLNYHVKESLKRAHAVEPEQKTKRRPPNLDLKRPEEPCVFVKPEHSPKPFWRPDSPLMTPKGQLSRPPTKSPPRVQKEDRASTSTCKEDRTIQIPFGKPANQLRGTSGQPLAPFRRGSLVRLANNSLRRVEDLNVDDFIRSAEQTPGIRIEKSTVQLLNENVDGTLTITFLTQGSNKVTVATSPDQPFFVINRGWCSFNPLRTLELYGLSCSRLQANDICVALSQSAQSSGDNYAEAQSK